MSQDSVTAAVIWLRRVAVVDPAGAREIADMLRSWADNAPTFTGPSWGADEPGEWGTAAQDAGRAPREGEHVVYYLYDGSSLAYIGSTENFQERMIGAHRMKGRFNRWQARACRTRQDAYALEQAETERLRPREWAPGRFVAEYVACARILDDLVAGGLDTDRRSLPRLLDERLTLGGVRRRRAAEPVPVPAGMNEWTDPETGRPYRVGTVDDAARVCGLTGPSAAHQYRRMVRVPSATGGRAPGHITMDPVTGRKLYDLDAVAAWHAARPGKGRHSRSRRALADERGA